MDIDLLHLFLIITIIIIIDKGRDGNGRIHYGKSEGGRGGSTLSL